MNMIKRVIIKAKGVAIMANTSINIRMDADLKRQFEAFCADMGMTMTTAFNVFARKAVREYRIPFEISGDVPNAETVEAIKEVKRMKADPSLGKTYSNVDQMMIRTLGCSWKGTAYTQGRVLQPCSQMAGTRLPLK